ncbi:triose-phosphate isomerase [Nanoarchaeota archaeon]
MRRPFIAGNWKMNLDNKQAVELVVQLKDSVGGVEDVDVLVCPPFTALSVVHSVIQDSNIKLGAQTLHTEDSGAYTGEISPLMLKDLVEYVIIGHSERREYNNETNEVVNKKINKALEHGFKVIMCCGESLELRKKGKYLDFITNQINEGLAGITKEQMQNITIAYEPIWAIGTGETASPIQAEEVHFKIRNSLLDLFDQETADSTRILYGGSVKPENVKELMQQENIDGGLVGGASLKADSFSKLVKFNE